MAEELIRIDCVISIASLSRSAIYDLISKNEFPKQVKLGTTRSAAWVRSEVEQWVDDQIDGRDKEVA